MTPRLAPVAAATAVLLLLVGCASTGQPPAAAPSTSTTTTSPATHQHPTTTAPEAPLRAGERFVTLRLPTAYVPKAPAEPGTDDYRCFLLDPKITTKSVVTGINVLPGNPEVVHHVILFRVPPDKVARAQEQDRLKTGEGWTCFGGTGVDSQGGTLDDAPWLGGWAPGGGERVQAADLGLPLAPGSQIIMQVHYNLLAGNGPDQSAAKLRVAADDGTRKTLDTMLLPAPVELPCRANKPGPLCDRAAAVQDVQARFGARAGATANALHLLCGPIRATATQSCTRPVTQAGTIRAVAGHMHLLGRTIAVTVNQGKADERTVLDIPVWDFDDQGSHAVKPAVKVGRGDTLTVTCTHDQTLRDQLPSFAGIPERYVVWGEGTTDEMCLGIVLLTRP